MPPRFFVWFIIVFWLATTTWLFYREIWPRFQPDRPPPLVLDFADEVRPSSIRWTVYADQRKIGSATRAEEKIGSGMTQFQRQKDRTVELVGSFEFSRLEVAGGKVKSIVSRFRVGAVRGELRELATECALELKWLGPVRVFADGEVCSGLFYPRLRVSGVGRTLRQSFTLDPVEVSAEESFLNPMHPLKEVRGLYQGQHWRMRLVDPLEDALSALLAKYLPGINMRVRYLEADVTAADLSLEGREVACWVIDYREPGKKAILARTWVRRKDGAVLRQEAAFQGNRLVMERGLVY